MSAGKIYVIWGEMFATEGPAKGQKLENVVLGWFKKIIKIIEKNPGIKQRFSGSSHISQLYVSSFFYLEAHLENSPSRNHIIKMPIKTLV